MSQILQAIRGMNDILPDEAELWEQFEEQVKIVRHWITQDAPRTGRLTATSEQHAAAEATCEWRSAVPGASLVVWNGTAWEMTDA